MIFSHILFRHPEDIPDSEVRSLRRLGFSAALRVMERWESSPRPRETQLDFLEAYLQEAGIREAASLRYAVAQAAQFLSQPSYFLDYVPENGVEDEEWLRFMIERQGLSDAELAFQIARVTGRGGTPDYAEVRKAREALNIDANQKSNDHDTIALLREVAEGEANARHLLSNREWMTERVMERDMSDGDIAKELGRVGLPCDRSTVRLYRNMLGLQRPGYAKKGEGN